MSVVISAGQLVVGRMSTVQSGGRPPLPHHTGSEARGAGAQLPVERVAEGDVLGRYATLNGGATNFHATSRHLNTSASVSGGVTATAQRAIAEYQSFAQLGKGRSVPLHNVDEYV